MSKTRVFSTKVCPYCIVLKQFLNDNKIEFEDLDVSENEEARKEMVEKTKQMGVPVIEIGGQFVIGFDKKKISELLGIKE
ncbi:MAG: NrdH-redoxin [Patescibacteria group bacterium]|nr:NrdH-redoxin [Patescibacteria group bacterium]